jgi:hypothetical protein
MTNEQLSISETLRLIQSEYVEIPGLHLTPRQVERLWRLDALTAQSLLRALVEVRFLRETRAGAFVRATLDEEARYRRRAVRGIRAAATPSQPRTDSISV